MSNFGKLKIEAVVITALFIASVLVFPMSGAIEENEHKDKITDLVSFDDEGEAVLLDTYYVSEQESAFVGVQNDIGYYTDAGNTIFKGLNNPIYIGEPIDENVPGRGRTATLEPDSGDSEDWYAFSACEGQDVTASLSSSQAFNLEICDPQGVSMGQGGDIAETGIYFLRIFADQGAGTGDYTFSISLIGQNDAGKGSDAGNDISSASSISPGSYSGYMSVNDQEDWYGFSANSGQGIFVTIDALDRSDYDIYLYNPSGELAYYSQYGGDTDELEFPADASGTWKIQFNMFPGWDESKWSENYFLYGSGAYEFELNIGGNAKVPDGPIPQKDITPIAQTFIIDFDENSHTDEFQYLAAIPAANYIDNGERYVSPIIYQGCDKTTEWFGTVDDMTQYLVDDWNAYLDRHDITSDEYIISDDPVQAAANIATDKWDSSSTAVLALDGSVYEDEITIVADEDSSLSSSPNTMTVAPGAFTTFGGISTKPMFIGSKYGAIHLVALGDNFAGDTGIVSPKYYRTGEDWWPYPYDFNGPDMDTFFPITQPGIWMPYVTSESGLQQLQIIQYPGDRYSIPIDNTDSSIEITITTDSPSNLIVYLVDPQGQLRKPNMPHYNGGDINPIHEWNGGHWQHNYDDFRTMTLEPHGDYSVEIQYPMEGTWTAIVVPFLESDGSDVGFNGNYHIIAQVREHNPKKVSAILSAANGAVLASAKHAPLLYVTEDSVPSETADAISELGVSNIIFVNLNDVSSASPSGSVTKYTTMQEIIDAIKADQNTENFITITSLGTGDGYFAPAAMMAAYHTSPILNIGETVIGYNTLGQAATWREYAGDYYHGCLSLGHLPELDEPFELEEPDLFALIVYFLKNKEFPPLGLDLKRTWMCRIHDGIYDMIDNYGLDLEGKEAYFFVGERENDIRDLVCRAMTGNNSYAGHSPLETSAATSAHIVRNILYPAIIYANPGRDITTSQLMNFPDGRQWTTNDGERYEVYSSRELRQSFSSHDRFYEGHCIYDNLLERYNEGASLCYYSGHGTGGSGISAQYYNINDVFPYVELTHDELLNFNFWDGWRGYMYDSEQLRTPRWGGWTWYNAVEPNLYDFIHFKWFDQQLENLHSIWDLWMSCTTQAHWGPQVYLTHGAVLTWGNAGTGLCPQADLLDDWWIRDVCVAGSSIGEAVSNYVWLHQRDYTTKDPTAMYGTSSMSVTNVQVIFGDPTMTIYSPEWTEPIPITG